MRQRNFLILAGFSLVAVVFSFFVSYGYLRKSIDHVVLEDVETVRDMLYASLKASIETQREQEFFVVKNLMNAQEWLSSHSDFSEKNLAWLIEFTEISGILLLNDKGDILSVFPDDIEADSALYGFVPAFLSEQDPYPYENEYAVNLATRVSGKVVVLTVVKSQLVAKRVTGGIGMLLRSLESDEKIVFVALQDTQGIWFGVKVPENISDVDEDAELRRILKKPRTFSRVNRYDGTEALEIAMPFSIENIFDGILRIAISRDYYARLYRGFVRNLILLHIFLYAMVLILLYFVFTREGLRLKLASFDTLTDHLPMGIALFGRDGKILYLNEMFRKLMGLRSTELKSLRMDDILPDIPVLEVAVKKDLFRKIRFTAVPIIGKGTRREATLVMVESTEVEDRLERAERIELLGEMAAQIAHEIKNPLNSISMIIQRLSSEFNLEPEMESRQLLGIMKKEVERIRDTVNRFYSILAPIHIKWECTDVCEMVEEVLAQFLPELKLKGIEFRTYYRACPRVMLDKAKVKEAFKNILRNSIEAIEENGEIKIAVVNRENQILVIFGDTGKGMNKDELEKVGVPFFTTKASGSGMGLFQVRKVMESHGGNLLIKSKKGKGTVVRVSFPYAKDRRC
ncbi:MAG: sensor histidine kinase [Candidatus Hydrothermia bacterium]